jgi:hypothetical protein
MLAACVICMVLSQSDPASDWAAPPQSEAPAPQPAPGAAPKGVLAGPGPEAPKPTAPARSDTPAIAEAPPLDVPSPDPTRFTWGHLGLTMTGAVGTTGYFGVRVEAGGVYGRPRRIAGTLNRAMGPTLGIAADLLAAKVRVRMCGTAGVCGSRYQGGLAARAAWTWGVIGSDGVVAPIHQVFFQAVAFLSSNSIPSAPLAPGNVWGEHGLRLDIGLTSGILRGSLWPRPGSFVIGGGLYLAFSFEWLLVNTEETGRFRGGVSLGLGI